MTKSNKIWSVVIFQLTFLVIIFFSFTAQASEASRHAAQTRTTTHSNDLWQRLRNGFSLKRVKNQEISKNETSFTKNPKFFYRITERSEPYLFYIVEEVERRGMPTEIALLPLIESSFDPHAKSSSNAAGLWQFIPATGKSFGLRQNMWLDERQDVLAATNAALDYLQTLHEKFDDWKLALAAYNWGQGSVSQALERNRELGLPTDFHSIDLPVETRNHIHKLIAIKNIIANPANYGIKLSTIPNRPYFEEVKAHQHMDKKLIAELAEISITEFNALNPAYKRAIVKARNPPTTLLLPVDNIDTFLTNLEDYSDPLMSWQIYRIKEGESINKISQRYAMTEAQIKEANEITENSNITHGQTILVPHASMRNDANISIVRKKPNVTKSHSSHIAKESGARSPIAKHPTDRRVKNSKIAHNPIIQMPPVGHGIETDISIVRKKPMVARQDSNHSIYIVKEGDTLSGIARLHGTTIQQIKLLNSNDDRLSVGQKLVLRLKKSPTRG